MAVKRRKAGLTVEGGTLHVVLRQTVQVKTYEPFMLEIGLDVPLDDKPVDAVATRVIGWCNKRLQKELDELKRSIGRKDVSDDEIPF